ncbi:hypothetical protein [Alkalihalobacillus sp. BA299]|uniref:hypothetical protein n=1 Tax=Alkalihalobacillus sp. BA299 TaxID=2815938 RepID=UPI001ADA9162|nr:hypothetical protein [Alkalihalobacillus sp. BA299]
MLSVTISYQQMAPMNVTIDGSIVNHLTEELQIKLHQLYELKIIHNRKEKYWVLSFPAESNLIELDRIHQLIEQLLDHCEGPSINDSSAFIGYLPDGGKAYIYDRYKEWREFILKAKHRSMEGQKVEVFSGIEKLADGILIDYELENDKPFLLKNVTLLTRFGEKVLTASDLSITATGEFF